MYQKIIIAGNLGQDPEMRYTPSGQAVTNFSVATNRQYTSNGQSVQETTWFRVSAWGKLAEACNQYLRRGRAVLIEGRLTPDQETGGPRTFAKQDGTPAASYDLTATVVKFLNNQQERQEAATQEDLPF